MSTNQEKLPDHGNQSFMKNLIIFLASILFFGLIGLSSSYFYKTSWTAEAHIGKPTVGELGNYYSLFSMYQLVNGEVNSLNTASDIVYKELKHQLSSYDTKKVFWEQSEYYKQKITGDTKEDLILLDKLIHSIEVAHFNNGNVITVYSKLDNPKQAKDILSNFIENVNIKTREVVYSELINQWKTLFGIVTTASQLKLGTIQNGEVVSNQDWSGKLNMMKSVAPLDNKLIAYRYTKSPSLPTSSNLKHIYWFIYGALIGLFIGFIILFLRKSR